MQVHCRCGQAFTILEARFPHHLSCHVCGGKFVVLEGGTTEEINAATDKLTAASHKLAEAMYKASAAQTPGGETAAGAGAGGGESADSKKKDDVVDAEFVDVDDKK